MADAPLEAQSTDTMPAATGGSPDVGSQSAAAPTDLKTATPAGAEASGGTVGGKMQVYLDSAMTTLEKYGLKPNSEPDEPQLMKLLEEVRDLDEARVVAIGRTIRHMSSFNQLVRDNVEKITIGNRYMTITQSFDSIREDCKTLIDQLADGKIGPVEKMSNLWMRLRRGTPNKRFDEIFETYKEVSDETRNQLEREQAIMEGYIDFRFALKEAEVAARELLELQTPRLEQARVGLSEAQASVDSFTGDDEAARGKLELARDESRNELTKQDRAYQLCKDIVENLSVGYDVGETLVTKLKQTHDVKDQLYRRAVAFFTTNEHVFTILGTVYTSQFGLHEATQATEAMKEGVNKSIEDVADLSRELEKAALKAGYGSTISPTSVSKLVSAISDYQVESLNMIADLRKESEENAQEIRRVVEEGKQAFEQTLARHAREGVL